MSAARQLPAALTPAEVEAREALETLYREIRALRIYEGATEVQQLIIGRDLLKEA